MRRLGLAMTALAFSAVGAMAADLKGGAQTLEYGSPIMWSGWYTGAHVGYSWGNADVTRSATNGMGGFTQSTCEIPLGSEKTSSSVDYEYGLTADECGVKGGSWTGTGPGPDADQVRYYDPAVNAFATAMRIDTGKMDVDGFFGGFDLSYKFQIGKMILEPFADISLGNSSGSASFIEKFTMVDGNGDPVGDVVGVGSLSIKKQWGATAGLKLGALVSSHDLIYGGAGLAYSSVKLSGGTVFDDVNYPASVYSNSDSAWGYTLLAGWEHAIDNHWHFGVEGRYTDLGTVSAASAGSNDVCTDGCSANRNGTTYTTSEKINADLTDWSVRGTVSYRW